MKLSVEMGDPLKSRACSLWIPLMRETKLFDFAYEDLWKTQNKDNNRARQCKCTLTKRNRTRQKQKIKRGNEKEKKKGEANRNAGRIKTEDGSS